MKNGEEVHIKSGYYSFSSEYPAGVISRKSKKSKSEKRKQFFKAFVAVVCCLVLIIVGYFGTSFIISVSNRAIPEETVEVKDENSETLLSDGIFCAYTLPADKLADSSYIKKLIRKIKWNDAEAVIIEFKNSSGELLYTSNQLTASGNSMYDNDTVRKVIQQFNNKKISVVAAFNCFEDPFAAAANPDMAVKYPDSDINWLDGEDGEEGNSWLNPYSSDALNYLESLIREIEDFGVEGFILRSASFPDKGDTGSTYYPGEEQESTRNSVISNFVTEVKSLTDGFVLTEVSATAVSEGTALENGDGVVIDFSNRPDGYTIDKSTDYISMLSLVSNTGAKLTGNYIPSFSSEEATRGFIRALKNAGYVSVIVD